MWAIFRYYSLNLSFAVIFTFVGSTCLSILDRESWNLNTAERSQREVWLEEGCSCLSQRFDVSHTSVSRMIQKYRNIGEHLRRPSHVTTEVQYRYLRLSTLRQRFVAVVTNTASKHTVSQFLSRLGEYNLTPNQGLL